VYAFVSLVFAFVSLVVALVSAAKRALAETLEETLEAP
jgi:hypothetical protein